MPAGDLHSAAQPQAQQPSHRGAPPSSQAGSSVSLPPKPELASWWKKFRKSTEKNEEKGIASGIFGIPLAHSIRYANVAISLTTEQGESFIYGYVPIVVAKCGVFLKEKATDVEGIFRLNGSAKRIKDLQVVFDSPERYGKGLDWTGYTVHDAANIFRRYLNQLPEPIVPLDFYEHFREPLRSHQAQAVGDMEAQEQDVGNFDHDGAVTTYQRLITELPPLNRQLLLYVLDLLAVFASKSEFNRMNSDNLAAIFQPGILSHPSHDMAPNEYRLSRDVLIFLIENQDNFLFGMSGTAVDEKTVKDMEQGPTRMPSSKVTVGRSASNASGGADSLRKFGRRNSVSSRHSKGSTGAASPGTPVTPLTATTSGSGVHRSNTVPAKRSPALGSARFQRQGDQGSPVPSTPTPPVSATRASFGGKLTVPSPSSPRTPSSLQLSKVDSASKVAEGGLTADPSSSWKKRPSLQNLPASLVVPPSSVKSPTRERKISNLFARSPILNPRDSDSEHRDGRQPNKLRKRPKIPGSANESAQSSQNSLHADAVGNQTFHTPLASPELASHGQSDPFATLKPRTASNATAPTSETPAGGRHTVSAAVPNPRTQDQAGNTLKSARSPAASIHSRSSFSDFEASEDVPGKAKSRRSGWLFSPAATKNGDPALAPPPPIVQHTMARGSNSSLGSSSHRPRKSFTGDSQQTQQTAATTADTSSGRAARPQRSSQESSSEMAKDNNSDPEKKTLFGKLKAKITQSKDEKREREAEKERERERTRSPARSDVDRASEQQRQNLSVAAANDHHHHFGHRGRSMDQQREKNASALPSVREAASLDGNRTEMDKETGAAATDSTMSPIPPTPVTAIRTVPENTTSAPAPAPDPAASIDALSTSSNMQTLSGQTSSSSFPPISPPHPNMTEAESTGDGKEASPTTQQPTRTPTQAIAVERLP